MQAILELYFERFVFVCSERRAEVYGTMATNVFIALSQVAALTGGVLADYVLGNFRTQNVSNAFAAVGVVLMSFSSWLYAVDQPLCCSNGTLCRELDLRGLPSLGLRVAPEVLVAAMLAGAAVGECRGTSP